MSDAGARAAEAPPRSAAAGPLPLVDLSRTWEPIRAESLEAFERIASTGAFVLGEELRRFETEFAEHCGAPHCVGVSDGTEAIRLALLALGVGPGDEVVTVPMTFIATVEAIAQTGARPVLADLDPVTRCMDPAALAAALTPATRAVVPVHLYGRPAPVEEIRSACADASVALLEDAAQAHGGELEGRRVGSLGEAAAFSFYPTKNLGAMGDGGAVVCADEQVAAMVRSLRHHGAAPDDANRHLRPGTTSRLDNLQAALLRIKLAHLDRWTEERRAAAARYREALAGLPLTLPPEDAGGMRQVFHLFVVEVDDRDRVLAALRAEGIGAAIHYPTPAHLQPAWQQLGYGAGDFPVAEALARRALTLPVFPGITDAEIERVADALGRALE